MSRPVGADDERARLARSVLLVSSRADSTESCAAVRRTEFDVAHDRAPADLRAGARPRAQQIARRARPDRSRTRSPSPYSSRQRGPAVDSSSSAEIGRCSVGELGLGQGRGRRALAHEGRGEDAARSPARRRVALEDDHSIAAPRQPDRRRGSGRTAADDRRRRTCQSLGSCAGDEDERVAIARARPVARDRRRPAWRAISTTSAACTRAGPTAARRCACTDCA